MKKLAILLFLFICPVLIYGQRTKMNEREAMGESHIDFTKQYIYFTIHGLIEIGGHTFLNDTCKNPIIFQATLDGITIIETSCNNKYTHRKCDVKGCNIIHLVAESESIIKDNNLYFGPQYFRNNVDTLYFDSVH